MTWNVGFSFQIEVDAVLWPDYQLVLIEASMQKFRQRNVNQHKVGIFINFIACVTVKSFRLKSEFIIYEIILK